MNRLSHYIIYIILFTFGYNLKAQNCFTADETVGCAPFTIKINDCTPGIGSIRYRYGATEPYTFDDTYTYSEPGFYSVTQLVEIAGNAHIETKNNYIRVVTDHEPDMSVYLCSGNNIRIVANETLYDEYEILYSTGESSDIIAPGDSINKSLSSSSPVTITINGKYDDVNCEGSRQINITPIPNLINAQLVALRVEEQSTNGIIQLNYLKTPGLQYRLEIREEGNPFIFESKLDLVSDGGMLEVKNIDTQNKSYCFRIVCYDRCGNELNSNILCSTPLNVTSISEENDLVWFLAPLGSNILNYEIIRNGELFTTLTENTFTDTTIFCGGEYCYNIKTIFNNIVSGGTNAYAITDTICVTGFSSKTPPAPIDFNASISNNKPLLSWQIPDNIEVKEYTITSDNNDLIFSGALNESSFTINTPIETNKSYCYKISYEDICNNTTDENTDPLTCPIILKVQETNIPDNILSWTDYIGYTQGVNRYTIEILDDNLNPIDEIANTEFTQYTDADLSVRPQIIRYRIKAYPVNTSESIVYSNIFTIEQKARFLFPTAFSPNDDGLNDDFGPVGKFITSFQLRIYNRWGQELFIGENKRWDGTYQNKVTPPGVYMYTATIEDDNNIITEHKGTITIIK